MGTQRTPAPLNSEKPWRPSCKTCSGDTPWQRSTLITISIKTKLVLVLNTNKLKSFYNMKIDNYALEGKYFNLDLDQTELADKASVYNESLDIIEAIIKGRMPEAEVKKSAAKTVTEVELVPEKLRCTDERAELTLGDNADNAQKDSLQLLYGSKVRGKMVFQDGMLIFIPTKKGQGSGSEQVLPKIETAGWKISKTRKETKFSLSFENDISHEELLQNFADRVEELSASLSAINYAYMHARDKADAISRFDGLLMSKRQEMLSIMNLKEYNA